MENKKKYYHTLIENNSRFNEVQLGEIIGLTEEETREIVAQLLLENKIEYIENSPCNYAPINKAVSRKYSS